MAVNRDKPDRWKADIAKSVDMYNAWFMKFAPQAFRDTRVQTTKDVEAALRATGNVTSVQSAVLKQHPEVLGTLRMAVIHCR
jgi:type II restriction enzyme